MQLEVGTVIGGALLGSAADGTLQGRAVGAGRELVLVARRRASAGHVVYDAEQPGSARRCVLTLWRADADPDRAYAGRAAYAASNLDHPHLEPVLAVGVDEVVGCVYVATPHTDAETLAAFVARTGGAPADHALHLLTQIGSGIGAAHALGFVHGGLRPENVLVMRNDSAAALAVSVGGQVFAPRDSVIDRPLVDSEPVLEERLWLAPELLPGGSDGSRAIDARADVWALGLLAFHVLTGGSYWREVSGELGAVAALAREVLIDPLAPPSLRAAELGVVLPVSFDAWFSRCVAREPATRFADANAAVAELPHALRDYADVARPAESGSLAPHLLGPADSSAPAALARPLYTARPPARPVGPPAPARSWVASLRAIKLPFAKGQPSWIAPAFASFALLCATAVVITLLARGEKKSSPAVSERADRTEAAEPAAEVAPRTRRQGEWLIDAETDPRSKTVLVNVAPSPELLATFRTFALTLDSQRLRSAFSGLTLGGSGSGFILVRHREPEPAVFVVTNRHVVTAGESVELTLEDGAKLGGDVVYTDFRHDVAVVAFTGKKPPVSTGLSLAPSPVTDLQAVLATGYPFLAGKPSFQISKGEVRNRSFERSFDLDEAKETYIQHSASIDPGSSGGPLLDDSKQVVGINTGLLPENHDVFLALPGAVIEDAVTRALEIQRMQGSPEWRIAGLQKACRELTGELGSPKPRFRTFLQFVSNRLVASEGVSSLVTLGTISTSVAGSPERSPMDRMRDALLARIYLGVKERGGVTADACGAINPTDAAEIVTAPVVRMTLQLQDGPAEIGWTFEHGHWRVAAAPLATPGGPSPFPSRGNPKRSPPRRAY